MVGLEALSMQGLPVDKLLLTRETEDQLADLAGNAMSTTVVGACMLAALVVGKKLLKKGDDASTYEEKAGNARDTPATTDELMEVDVPSEDIEGHISGEAQLVERHLDLSKAGDSTLSDLLAKADASARLCECEGRSDMTQRVLNRCQDCGSSSCIKCGGRPEHSYQPIDFDANPRLSPSNFARDLKAALPMSLSLLGITEELLNGLKIKSAPDFPDRKWKKWRTCVLRAAEIEQRFVELKRQEIWVVSFKSPHGALELLLHPQQPEWRFFANADKEEPANSDIRRVLEFPVGRLRCKDGLLIGVWEFALPQPSTVKIGIKGIGEQVPSWEAKLGLLGEYKDRIVYPKLEITVPEENLGSFDRDISGIYTLLDKCGTATSALHKKESTEAEGSMPPVFLFLDPTRCGTQAEDSFVISISTRRYQFGETRPIICKLEPKWRQTSVTEEEKTVSCHIPCLWTACTEVSIEVGLSMFSRMSCFLTSYIIDYAALKGSRGQVRHTGWVFENRCLE